MSFLWIVVLIIVIIIIIITLREWAVHFQSEEDNSSETAHQGEGNDQKCGNIVPSISFKHCCCDAVRTYALEELKMATKDFKIRLGVGATSDVYLAELAHGKFAAVKRVNEKRGGSRNVFMNELSVLLRISHPNLVGLMGFCLEKGQYLESGEQLLLLEYAPNKSLFHRMHTRDGKSLGVLSWSNRLSIALDVAHALQYLHSVADPPITHRDVKSSNILLINDDHAKLADFGLCKLGSDEQSAHTPIAVKGSLGYVDTYYLNTGLVSQKSDVYSFGVLLLELTTGLRSMLQGSTCTLAVWTQDFRSNEKVEVLVRMLDPKLNIGDVNLEQLRVLVNVANQALLSNPEARPDMTQIVDVLSNCIESQPLPV